MLAAVVLVVETLLCLSVWGPQPLAWLWIGSQVDYHAGSHMLGIVVAFFGILASLFVTLSLAVPAGPLLAALRRAAGHDQRDGALARIFGATAVIALVAVRGLVPR